MVSSSELRVALSQSPVTERVQHLQQQHPDLSQRQFALQLQESQENKKIEVQGAQGPELEKIRDQGKENLPHGKTPKKPHEQDQALQKSVDAASNDAEEIELSQGKYIDIRI